MTDPIARLNAALEGRYAIEREIGEGGMATVYLAEDLRHERKVALKVLKPELAAVVGAERFLAEIKTTANLQHPHILALYDSGEADGFLFFVGPYIEGDTLRDKIDREKQLSIEEALKITEKVASALDYAHEHGVVHRDIKPGNILLSEKGEPTVADFGIALAVAQAGGGRVTETGLSVGTPHYMSPEQATGDRDVDPRTDVYALGSVLYEMLVGEPPYSGTTAQAVLAKILTDPAPAPTKVRLSIPPNVDAAIRRALEKLPADRFTTAQDFSQALGDAGFRHGEEAAAGIATTVRLWNPLSMVLGVSTLVATLALGWLLLRPEPVQPVSRQVLSTRGWGGLGGSFGRYSALAPDGSSMILPDTTGPTNVRLALKLRGSTEITPIPGTEQGRDVVYSPDGQWIAYGVGTELFKRPVVGGAPVRLAEDAASGTLGLAWLDDGTILYERSQPDDSRLFAIVQIPEDGGEARVVFWPEEDPISPIWVIGLPGGRGALVSACSPAGVNCGASDASLFVVDLRDLSSELILEQVPRAWYTPTGHIVYVRDDGAVFAVPFDLGSLELAGSSVPLFEGVRLSGGRPDMRIASDGTLLYVEGESGPGGLTSSLLVAVNRDGQERPLRVEAQPYFYPRISPDGGRLAAAVLDGGDTDLWVFDLDRGSRSRITFGGNNRYFPVWTPTGDRLTFADGATPPSNAIQIAPADGDGETEALLEREGLQFPTSWSRDGSLLAYHERLPPDTQRDIWVLPMDGDPVPFLVTPFQEHAPSFSPDGRWLAYVSDESGQDEVYVQPYPGPGPQFTVSTSGGREPIWSPDGSELFYRTETELMAVDVVLGETFRAETPQPLFDDTYRRDNTGAFSTPNYDIMPDGQSFVMVSSVLGNADLEEVGEGPAVILVTNFFEELRQVVPD